MHRVVGERVYKIVFSRLNFLSYRCGTHQIVAGQKTVPPIGVEARIVAHTLRQAALDAQGDVVFLAFGRPEPVAVAHQAVPHREIVAFVRLKVRAGRRSCSIDRVHQVRLTVVVAVRVRWSEGEYIDRRRILKARLVLREVRVQMQFGIVAQGMVQHDDGGLLLAAAGVPPDVAIGETAAQIVRCDPGRIDERTGVAMHRVAVPQRDRPCG